MCSGSKCKILLLQNVLFIFCVIQKRAATKWLHILTMLLQNELPHKGAKFHLKPGFTLWPQGLSFCGVIFMEFLPGFFSKISIAASQESLHLIFPSGKTQLKLDPDPR